MNDSPIIIFTGTTTQADYLKSILQANGIPAWLQDTTIARVAPHLSAATGFRSAKVTVAPSDVERACQLLKDSLSEFSAEPWTCPGCGEEVEGQFAQCWNCGAVQLVSENGAPNGST